MKKEYWKPVVGFEGLYEVSNWGKVKSLNYNHTGKEKILKPKTDRYGYLRVCLHKSSKRYYKTIHRLVAEAFLPNDDLFKTDINHKDENKENNHVDNLEWCNAQYNNNYGTRIERAVKLYSKAVLQYSFDGTLIKEWQSSFQVKQQLGFDNSAIAKCCNGKFKQMYGFIWRYKNEEQI